MSTFLLRFMPPSDPAASSRRKYAAVTTHGRRTKAADAQNAEFRQMIRTARETLQLLRGRNKV
jgi:hypothetical protein